MFSLRKKLNILLLVAVLLLSSSVTGLSTSMYSFEPASAASTGNDSYVYVELSYLVSHAGEYRGSAITTRGIVKFYASIYMYEDFWLQTQNQSGSKIPAVLLAGLPIPREGALVEVSGTVEYSNLEGGFFYLNVSSVKELKNVILIGWDGVQRNHLFELLNRGNLSNLKSFIDNGTIANVTVVDHRTDTKAGWTQILTGYRWWKTGVYNNVYWFHSIPEGYTIPERVERYFGKDNVATGFITGKRGHMEAQDGTGSTATGQYTHEAIYANLPSQVDVCNVGDRNASVVGPLALQFLQNCSKSHFFAFFHFSDPDSAGHTQPSGGENSVLYEQAIIRCDYWLGQILSKLNALNLSQNTLIYVTADHGFDEGGYSHNNAPYVYLATNDDNVSRDGDQVDVAATVYYGLGMWGDNFSPALDGYPLQTALPTGEEQKRQEVIADNKPPPTPSMQFRAAELSSDDEISFNASDAHLSAMLFLIDDVLKADGPWIWKRNSLVETYGSYRLGDAGLNDGSHTVKILAFDEHGALNGPSTKSNVVTYSAAIQALLSHSSYSSSAPSQSPSPSPPSSLSPSPSTSPSPIPFPSPTQSRGNEASPIVMYLIAIASTIIALIALTAKVIKKRAKLAP